jgi:hypothetical protein
VIEEKKMLVGIGDPYEELNKRISALKAQGGGDDASQSNRDSQGDGIVKVVYLPKAEGPYHLNLPEVGKTEMAQLEVPVEGSFVFAYRWHGEGPNSNSVFGPDPFTVVDQEAAKVRGAQVFHLNDFKTQQPLALIAIPTVEYKKSKQTTRFTDRVDFLIKCMSADIYVPNAEFSVLNSQYLQNNFGDVLRSEYKNYFKLFVPDNKLNTNPAIPASPVGQVLQHLRNSR